ncbi:hypothetical protein [Streptomyces sp. LNU-CPARS28]|uniref:hypothetical protein n=1 Tax=Streptomyces sp. LNU-CPARS28 TaxID=3137371 RepID=UPI003134E9FE
MNTSAASSDLTPDAALVRLRQYQERPAPTWSTASYGGSSAEPTLAEIGRVLAAEVERLRARVEELVAQRDDLLLEDALAEHARDRLPGPAHTPTIGSGSGTGGEGR